MHRPATRPLVGSQARNRRSNVYAGTRAICSQRSTSVRDRWNDADLRPDHRRAPTTIHPPIAALAGESRRPIAPSPDRSLNFVVASTHRRIAVAAASSRRSESAARKYGAASSSKRASGRVCCGSTFARRAASVARPRRSSRCRDQPTRAPRYGSANPAVVALVRVALARFARTRIPLPGGRLRFPNNP